MAILTTIVRPGTLTREEIVRFRTEAAIAAQNWTDRKLLAVMGFLNTLLRCAAVSHNAIEFTKGFTKAKVKVMIRGLRRLIDQGVTVVLPTTYMRKFLKEQWGGSTAGTGSLRRIREELSEEFGLFEFDRHQKGEMNRRATYREVQVSKILLFYEALEKVWIARNGFNSLPSHKGYLCKLLYDSIFTHSLGMNREQEDYPLTEAEAAAMRAQRRLDYKGNIENEYRILSESQEEFRRIGLNITNPDVWRRLTSRMAWLWEQIERLRSQPVPELPY